MKHLFYILALFVAVSCTKNDEKEQESSAIPTIDIEKGLKDFKVRKLSDFAKKIRYVRL